jgi:hypothetical protein
MSRPDFVDDDHLKFLDELRESGIVNMFGATSFIVEAFNIDRKLAEKILTYWMESFGKEDR